jgi:hypothetical protein
MSESSVLQRIVNLEFDDPVRTFANACAADSRYTSILYDERYAVYFTEHTFICVSC